MVIAITGLLLLLQLLVVVPLLNRRRRLSNGSYMSRWTKLLRGANRPSTDWVHSRLVGRPWHLCSVNFC